jgi:predicted transcriptional regulator
MTGRDILAERKKRGIAQTTFATACELDKTVISAIEAGDIEVTPGELVRLWNVLDSMRPESEMDAATAIG